VVLIDLSGRPTQLVPLVLKSVAGAAVFHHRGGLFISAATPHQRAALGLDPILDPNSPTLTETRRHRLVCQNSKSADKIKTNDTSQHAM
jgi:hypothetical protein